MGQSQVPSSYDETIGWVEMDICFNIITEYNDGYAGCINALGRITFDEQPYIEISNTLCTDLSCLGNVDSPYALCPENDNYQSVDAIDGNKVATKIDETDDFNFQISTNISKNQVIILGIDDFSKLNCSVISAAGELVKNVDLNTSKYIDISNFTQGVYYVKIYNNLNSQTKKFVRI